MMGTVPVAEVEQFGGPQSMQAPDSRRLSIECPVSWQSWFFLSQRRHRPSSKSWLQMGDGFPQMATKEAPTQDETVGQSEFDAGTPIKTGYRSLADQLG
jgi:hypothetical protein